MTANINLSTTQTTVSVNTTTDQVTVTSTPHTVTVGTMGARGFSGSQGYTGSQGIIGYTGSFGYTGSQGITGFTGSQGIQGFTGSLGYTGSIGYTGSQGITGFTGSQGIQGFTGSFGITGFTGSQGITGYTGSQGIQGFTGSFGITGFTGSQGITGFTGSFGTTGFTGSFGDIGFTGSQGITGFTGSIGGDIFMKYYSRTALGDCTGMSNGAIRFSAGSGSALGDRVDIPFTDTFGRDLTSYVLSWFDPADAFTLTSRGYLIIKKASDISKFIIYEIIGLGQNIGCAYHNFSCTIRAASLLRTDLTENETLLVSYQKTGVRGIQGFTGSFGTTGFTGSLGTTGFTGSQGITGFTGSFGTQGFTGSLGFTGSQGTPGAAANIGYTGSRGTDGTIGVDGYVGSRGFTGSQGATGTGGVLGWAGAFSDYSNQSISNISNSAVMNFSNVDYSNGITLVDNTKFTVANAGVYNFQWSGQFVNTDNADHDVYIWIQKNGVDVPGTTGRVSVVKQTGGAPGHLITGWNFVLDLAASDYIQLYWSTDSTQTSIITYANGTTPTRPGTASLVATLTQVMYTQQGYTGSQGNLGFTGSQGALGYTGSAGGLSSNVTLTAFNETVVTTANISGNVSLDVSTGSIFKANVTGNISNLTLGNATAGTSASLVLTQTGSFTLSTTSAWKFAGGSKTISTGAGVIDLISVFYDGSTYYASLTKGYS